jgi:hypothetical protein
MFRKIFFVFISLLFLSTANIYCQTEENDSTITTTEHNWKWFDWNKNEWFRWRFHGKPFIEVNYGLGLPKHDKLVSDFADVGLMEVKLGFTTKQKYYEDDLIDFKERFVFISKIGSQLKSQDIQLGDMETNLWRFGIAQRSGFGYELDKFQILPYHQSGIVWSRLDVRTYPALFYKKIGMTIADARTDTDILNRFHDANRFGTEWEGGVRIQYSKYISLNAGYEAAVIFPRHMFWKHAGSLIIEEVGLHLLDQFVDEVADSSPYLAPVVSFILKNAYSYGFYALKKDKMNWPFTTESPLTYETFKFGMTFTF